MTKETLKNTRWGTGVKYKSWWQKGSELFTYGRYYGLDLSETLAEVSILSFGKMRLIHIPIDNLELI